MSKRDNQQTFNDVLPCCLLCGAALSGRFESLSKGLCRTLVKFYEAARVGGSVHARKDAGFTKSEFTNFQKLRYFGLIAQTETPGCWRVTALGLEFLLKNKRVPKKVFVFRNDVKERSAETVSLVEALRSEPYWLQKQDYVAEMSAAD